MSKKKKFAGKKTKLAEHALTQVLEKERPYSSESMEGPSPTSTLAQAVQALRQDQLHLEMALADVHSIPTQEQLEIADIYLAFLQELADMREFLRAPDLPVRPRSARQKPGDLPNPEVIEYSLQVIGNTLRDLKIFMDSQQEARATHPR
jgi:hypothetical protein